MSQICREFESQSRTISCKTPFQCPLLEISDILGEFCEKLGEFVKNTPSLKRFVDFGVWFLWWIFRGFFGPCSLEKSTEKSTKNLRFPGDLSDQNPLREISALRVPRESLKVTFNLAGYFDFARLFWRPPRKYP